MSTPVELLDTVLPALGVVVTLADDLTKLRMEADHEPPADVLAAITTNKPEIMYRLALRTLFDWTCLEADGTPRLLEAEAAGLLTAMERAGKLLGHARADAVRHDEYKLFYVKASRCPTCGLRGVSHQAQTHGPEGAV
jgi:hypothetical protein